MPERAYSLPADLSPFEVPEDRRPLRHAFYLRHPELDQRGPRDRDLDAAAYAARSPRPEVTRAQLERAGYADGEPYRRPPVDSDDLADAVRAFLDGGATLDDLREALDRADGP